jgi:hypothetical protein
MVWQAEQGGLGLFGGGVPVGTILAQERLGALHLAGEVFGDVHVRRRAGDGVFGGAGLTIHRPMLRCAPHRAVSWQRSRLYG